MEVRWCGVDGRLESDASDIMAHAPPDPPDAHDGQLALFERSFGDTVRIGQQPCRRGDGRVLRVGRWKVGVGVLQPMIEYRI